VSVDLRGLDDGRGRLILAAPQARDVEPVPLDEPRRRRRRRRRFALGCAGVAREPVEPPHGRQDRVEAPPRPLAAAAHDHPSSHAREQ
jgi:hypothetical protein